MSTSSALDATPDSTSLELPTPSSDPLLALWIVLGVLAGLALVGAAGFVAFKKLRASKPGGDAAVAEEKKEVALKAFDPDARYSAMGADASDARYSAF